MQDERLILMVSIKQRQANVCRPPACRRRRKAEVLKIEAHGLLVLDQRVPISRAHSAYAA